MKTLALLPLLFLCIWSTGCKKDEIIVPNNPNQTILQNIQPGAWVLNSDNSAYMVDISMPEIDADANELDAIVVSVSAGATGAYEAIPNVYSGVSFSYTHQVGRVTLEVQSADGTAPVRPTSLIRAKIVIIRSN